MHERAPCGVQLVQTDARSRVVLTHAQSMSTAVKTPDGIVLRLPVPGRFPYKVVWTSDGPRVEAVFPHP